MVVVVVSRPGGRGHLVIAPVFHGVHALLVARANADHRHGGYCRCE